MDKMSIFKVMLAVIVGAIVSFYRPVESKPATSPLASPARSCQMPRISVFDEFVALVQEKQRKEREEAQQEGVSKIFLRKRSGFRQALARLHSKQMGTLSPGGSTTQSAGDDYSDASNGQNDGDGAFFGQKQDDSNFRQSIAMFHAKQSKQTRSKRIIGGREISYGQWPFLVSLRFDSPEEKKAEKKAESSSSTEKEFEHLCGATLIHPQFALSALHCFEASDAYPYLTMKPEDWAVKVGEHHLYHDEEAEDLIPLSKIITHLPNKRESQLNGDDIILLKLSRPVRLDRYVEPVCLPSPEWAEPSAGSSCMTAGWGLENEADVIHSLVPRHVELSMWEKAKCQAIYGEYNITLGEDMICAGGHSEGGKDSCRYDSGGPLICRNKDGIWNYYGIVSFGAGCGQAGIPGIYTRVVAHLSWLEKAIEKALAN